MGDRARESAGEVTEISFMRHGVRCAAWWYSPTSTDLVGENGGPCVVMAHGFGGTMDTGLESFAQAFSNAGIDVLTFDYRGFGHSKGSNRQHVSHRLQRQDYVAAVEAARRLPGIDPARIVLWGTSYSGGHVLAVAADDPLIAAVVSMTPATDGLAALVQIGRYAGVGQLARATGHGLLDVARAAIGRTPHFVPVVGQPGTTAIISTPGAEEGYLALAGPTWRNEVRASGALGVGLNRPVLKASRISCPLLVQVGTRDQVAPPAAARRTAAKAGRNARLAEYPADHFDVYDGPGHDAVLADQVDFLRTALTAIRR